jgi:putative ABC transport system permease protein
LFDQMIMLHWKYFDETTPYNRGTVGWYVSRVNDVNQADRVAKAIDAISANSDHETRTQTEQAAPQLDQAAGRYRPDRRLDHGRGVLHADAAVRQHDDAGGARTHVRTGGAQDDRFLQPACWRMVLAESVLLLLLGGVIGLGWHLMLPRQCGAAAVR